MDNQLNTEVIAEEIGRCEEISDFRSDILPKITSQQEKWMAKMEEIIQDASCTGVEFANMCRVSRMAVNKWRKGSIPNSRERFIRIGIVARYDTEKVNELLTKYGRFPALYSKSLEDCVCMYVLNNYSNESAAYAIERYDYILDRIKSKIVQENSEGAQDESTVAFDAKLSQIQDEDGLERFITDNINVFRFAYRKFYAYVNLLLETNYSIYDANSLNDLAVIQGWSSSLRQSAYEIQNKCWQPTRNKIISLGLHLNQDHEQIDQMLTLAHMDKLYAKNIFESVIMFILDDALLNGLLEPEDGYFEPDALCKYARKVIEELNLPELDFFISEFLDDEDE